MALMSYPLNELKPVLRTRAKTLSLWERKGLEDITLVWMTSVPKKRMCLWVALKEKREEEEESMLTLEIGTLSPVSIPSFKMHSP